MADATESTTHGLYLSGPFEIEAKTSGENGWRREYRTYTTFIGCGGAAREARLRYEIVARGFSQANFKLEPGNIYFLRGAFIPTKSLETNDVLHFEASDRVFLNSAAAFDHTLVDSVGVTGIGIVCDMKTVIDPPPSNVLKNPADENKVTTVVTVLHSDFDPSTKKPQQFTVEYRIPPTPNLIGTPKILQKGREFQFHGFVKDFDTESMRYVVVASKISPTNGGKEYNVDTNGAVIKQEDTKPTIHHAKKPMKFNPRSVNSAFKPPLITTDTESGSSLRFGPSDNRLSSFSPPSLQSTSALSPSVSPTKANADETPALVPKKRGRAQPKRATKRSKTLDLTI